MICDGKMSSDKAGQAAIYQVPVDTKLRYDHITLL